MRAFNFDSLPSAARMEIRHLQDELDEWIALGQKVVKFLAHEGNQMEIGAGVTGQWELLDELRARLNKHGA